eukprot:3859962-Amphidinium_carterae.1
MLLKHSGRCPVLPDLSSSRPSHISNRGYAHAQVRTTIWSPNIRFPKRMPNFCLLAKGWLRSKV